MPCVKYPKYRVLNHISNATLAYMPVTFGALYRVFNGICLRYIGYLRNIISVISVPLVYRLALLVYRYSNF
jgi:hypothetical protein